MKHEGWPEADALGVSVSASARSRLETFERMLLERGIPMGMIAASDAPRIRERHVLDCLRATHLLPEGGSVCDLGSGAGLPGLVLSVVRPDLRWTLVEVRRNRVDFLNAAIATLELEHVTVYPRRLATFRELMQTCLARAFAPPTPTWHAAERILAPTGRLIYWAGASFDASRDVPEGVATQHFSTPGLARSGPLVIMARS